MVSIKKTRTLTPKQKPDQKSLGFGKFFSDHMLVVDYSPEKGWHNAEILPYGPIPLEPTAMVFHYAQEVFEGMKAYRDSKGEILIFRPEMNGKRLNNSHERLVMPQMPVDDFVDYVRELVLFDQDWIPTEEGTSLYIRPFTIATDAMLGVHPSKTYKFIVVLSPVGAYFANGFGPVKIYVEDEYIRAAPGGTGFAKCGGNYASSLAAAKKAASLGYAQVLWLDGIHKNYVQEVGAMNIMFKIDGEIITAPIEDGTILPGVTRESCMTILRDWGYKVTERQLSIDEVAAAGKSGKLEEIFGTGTAAVICPVGEVYYKGETFTLNGFKTGELTQKLYDELTGIQWGKRADKFGWVKRI